MLFYTNLRGIDNEKTLGYVKSKCCLDQKFVIQEKIHGSNVSFRFTSADSPMTVHSRNQQIGEHDKFFGIQALLPKYKIVEERIRDYLRKNETIKSFYVFGEYFGSNIQLGIDYGAEKKILFFDIYMNEELVDYVTFERLQKEVGIEDYCVKPLAIVDNFEEALKFDIAFNTNYSDKTSDNLCEGIVIKQYQRRDDIEVTISTDCLEDEDEFSSGSLLMCKRKNIKFLETVIEKKQKEPKKNAIEKPVAFISYINDNRIQSYISKIAHVDTFGEKQLDEIINDALKDYLIDFQDFVLDEKTKTICKTKIQGLHKKMKAL